MSCQDWRQCKRITVGRKMSKKKEGALSPAEQTLAALGLTQTVGVTEAKASVKLALHTKSIPFLLSATSQGKSTMMAEVAEEMGMRLVVFNMVSVDPSDLAGIPFPSKDGKTFHFLKDGRIPCEDDEEPVLLFLDEVNRCQNSTVNAVFQLLNGHLGSSKLGPNVKIVMAANPAGQGYQVASAVTRDPALIARVSFIPMALGMFEALMHMRAHKWHPCVIMTLEKHPAQLFDQEASPGRVFATPRGWERASQLITAFEAGLAPGEALDRDNSLALRTLIEGTIGITATSHLYDSLLTSGPSYIKVEDFFRGLVNPALDDRALVWIQQATTKTADQNLVLFERMDSLAAWLVAMRPAAEQVIEVLARLQGCAPSAVHNQLMNRLRQGVAKDEEGIPWLRSVTEGLLRHPSIRASGRDRTRRNTV